MMTEENKCKHCQEPLVRRENEQPSKFRRRNFCNRQCANAFTKGGVRQYLNPNRQIRTHKVCKGPLHPEGKLLPLSKYYPIKDKRWPKNTNLFQSQCKDCQMARHGYNSTKNRGHVPLSKIKPVLDRLLETHGTWKAVGEAAGISRKTIYSLRYRKQKKLCIKLQRVSLLRR